VARGLIIPTATASYRGRRVRHQHRPDPGHRDRWPRHQHRPHPGHRDRWPV